MIVRKGKNIIGIMTKGYPLKMVYRKGYLIWSNNKNTDESNSCFGRGYWINSLPWLNTDAWKNN